MAEDKTKVNKNVRDKAIFEWDTKEFADYKKGGGWFMIVVLVSIGLIAFFIWQGNWTAAGVVGAASLALIIQSQIRSKKIKCEVYRDGVIVDGKAHPYEEFKSFWILIGDHPKVRFERTSKFSAPFEMPIADEDPEQVRLFLAKFLPEDEEKGEDLTDTIQRWFRF